MTTTVPGEPFIAFKDVRLGFAENEVLRGISFEVWPGETKVLLGESGSGKTLIMKLAAGLLRPDSGTRLGDGRQTSARWRKTSCWISGGMWASSFRKARFSIRLR